MDVIAGVRILKPSSLMYTLVGVNTLESITQLLCNVFVL